MARQRGVQRVHRGAGDRVEGLPAAITLICAGTRVEGVELLFEEPYERVLPIVERWLSFESY